MTNFTPRIKRLNTGGQDQLKLGLALAKEGREKEALEQFQVVLQENPASVRAHLAAGGIQFKQKHYEEALAHFQAASKLDPMKPQPVLRAGKVYLKQRNLDEALQQFRAVTQLDPRAVQAYGAIGQILARQGKDTEAIEEFRKALRLDPQAKAVRLRLAQVYVRQEKFPEAIAELKTAITVNSESWQAHAELGRIYLKQQDYKAASEMLGKAVALNSELTPALRLNLVEALTQNGQVEQAIALLKDIPQSKPLLAKQHKLWGDIYYRQGLHKEATEEYRAATLLGTSADADSEMMDSLDALEDEDNWEELAGSYKSSADAIAATAKEGGKRRRRGLR